MAPEFSPTRVCEFWLGRAGSGKTHGCLEAMARELIRSPRGEPLILLVPEQATAQMERRLATWPGLLGGFTRARVFSFDYLAREAQRHVGQGGSRQEGFTPQSECRFPQESSTPRSALRAPHSALGESGRIMLLRRSLRRLRDRLTVFRASAGLPGIVECLSRTILEFQRYGWEPGTLEDWLGALDEDTRARQLLPRKLSDIALVWRAYERDLRQGGWDDPEETAQRAAAAIRQWPALAGARIWVDGFASLTEQESALLAALLERADGAVIALCADPEPLLRGAPSGERVGPERLFENVEETYHLLAGRLREAGWVVEAKGLPDAGQPTRFSAAPALAWLESKVLGRLEPQPYPGSNEKSSSSSMNLPSFALDAHDIPIELIEAADRRAEIEAVARRIVALCRVEASGGLPPLTWREIAVLARDLAPYEALVREVFAQFEIPCFLDRPRQVERHPLARLLLSALGVLRSGWRGEAVLRQLKSGLAGLRDEDAIAALENHILATDPRGRRWQERAALPPGLWEPWRAAAGPLETLEAGLRRGDNPARALWAFLEEVQAAATLEAWTASERAASHEEEAQLHEQVWAQTLGWLEELDTLATALPELLVFDSVDGADRVDGVDEVDRKEVDRFYPLLDELAALVEAALCSTRARLIPPTLNQVTVGSVDRSRTPQVRAAFVLGLNEREFPRLWNPDPMLGDEERQSLSQGGRRLGPDTARKRLHEHFLVYIALTRASQRLCLSRPLIDDEGKASEPSPWFAAVAKAFAGARIAAVQRGGRFEDPVLPVRPEEWAARLGSALGHADDPRHARELLWLMRAGDPLEHPGLRPFERTALEVARSALAPPRAAALGADLARAYWQAQPGEAPGLRVTALEHYGECPFKFFAGAMLGLTERSAARLSGMDLGMVRHDILETLFNHLEQGREEEGLAWGKTDPREADALIERRLAHWRRVEGFGARLEGDALESATLAQLGLDLKLLVRSLKMAGARCAFVQTAAEWAFGQHGEVVIEAGGLRLALRGKIDRVDSLPLEPLPKSNTERLQSRSNTGRLQSRRDDSPSAQDFQSRRDDSPSAQDFSPGTSAVEMPSPVGTAEISTGKPLSIALSATGATVGLLIDYKSGHRKADYGLMHAGVELQLLSYGLALRRMARREGRTFLLGGMFYWPLAAPMTEAARGELGGVEEAGAGQEAAQAEAGPQPLVDERWFARCAPSGLFSAEQASFLDMTVEAGQRSPVFGFRRNKDGALAKSGRGAWPSGAIDRWLDLGEEKIQEWVEAIVAGRIALAPYATPKRKKIACQTCAMEGVCRRADLAVIPYRDLPAVSRDQLAREWGLGEA